MYLKKLVLENFRKFRNENNEICFVASDDYKNQDAINIAPRTTLIIGKNNSGKTTVIEALKRLVQATGFSSNDYNFDYLQEILSKYTPEYFEGTENKEVPILKFKLTIVIDNSQKDLLTNIIPFMSLEDVKDSEVEIIIQWAPKNEELFLKSLKQFINDSESYRSRKFDKFLELIDRNEYCFSYFNSNMDKREGFSLKKLIDLEAVSANNIRNEECLSMAFSKIVEYRYNQVSNNKEVFPIGDIDKEIININEMLTERIDIEHTQPINSALCKIIASEKCQVLLKSDLSFKSLLKNVLKYEYLEGNRHIPENQFGLGYTNLMMIIADIIKYMEKYPEDSFNSQINLISIEEPETFMHPQMQELFIKNVNEMISALLESKNKHVNSQIIITTHSSHILNSKIHEGNTFDNINYITTVDNRALATVLDDNAIVTENLKATKKNKTKRWKTEQSLKFIKKHMKYKVSEIFFADAVIFVEGITEYTLLQFYLDQDERFNKYYISLILIDGAHAKVYEKITRILNIPTLIITDIDFKREKFEKGEKDAKNPRKKRRFLQMDSKNIKNRLITNTTISHFYKTSFAESIINNDYYCKDNLMVVCQKDKINGYYATSFEEAFILTNDTCDTLKNALKKIKPDIYSEVLKAGGIKDNSYKLQKKLCDSKGDFANEILYKLVVGDTNGCIPTLPNYIIDGLTFIDERLRGNANEL